MYLPYNFLVLKDPELEIPLGRTTDVGGHESYPFCRSLNFRGKWDQLPERQVHVLVVCGGRGLRDGVAGGGVLR